MSSPPPEPSPVPRPMRAASEWSWRVLLVAAAVIATAYALGQLSEVSIPLVVATLLAALLAAITTWLAKFMPRGIAAGITLLGTIAVIVGLVTLVSDQISNGIDDMATQAATGVTELRDYLHATFGLTNDQVDSYVAQLKTAVENSANLRTYAAQAGVTATHFVAGLFIVLFTLFFFLYDGAAIWAWLVRLFPRSARDRVDSSGHVAWGQLAHYTHATVIVAAVDAVGITIGALILQVPFALAIGVLVFLLAFIPIVGAFLSGLIAVLLALVAHGPVNAIIMLAVVVGVQQLESHILQPFILGRSVKLHPLAVILAIATGAILGGIVGTLIAVPTIAVANAVGTHLLSRDTVPGDGEPDELPDDEAVDEPKPATA